MKELIKQGNLYIKGKNLTEKLILMSDGDFYIIFYQGTFASKIEFEEVARNLFLGLPTIEDLKIWIDKVIEKPRN